MNTMLQEVTAWMHRNARELELACWRYHFENGSAEAVLTAILPYRNEDGGFGHAIEADNWNPSSTAISTITAFELLLSVGMDGAHPVMQGMLDYFENTSDHGVWHFTVPANNDGPHAPWWTYTGKHDDTQDMGVTSKIDAFALNYADPARKLYQQAAADAVKLLGNAARVEDLGDNGIPGLSALAKAAEKHGIGGWDTETVAEQLRVLVNHAIERDTAKWAFYGCRPSNLIRSPQSPYYAENKEIVEAELDYLEKTRHLGGVWDITWTWFDNMAQYAPQFAVSDNWWKGVKAIENMTFLRNFGRVK